MSAILSADDLNDFISPGVACIKPVETLPPAKTSDSSNPYEVTTEDTLHPSELPPAQISLTDCLACSGCVTSAEAVLVSLQSHSEVLHILDDAPSLKLSTNAADPQSRVIGLENDRSKIFVASVSPQTRASVAATYGVSERKAGNMIEQLLSGSEGLAQGGTHGNRFEWVVDTNVARQACLVLGAEEVLNATMDRSQPKPILTSACPGWICYAEKTHPYVLPHLSKLKSPQAVMGTMLKSVISRKLGVAPSRIWHVALMPCFDKKLEASREELTSTVWGSRDEVEHSIRDVDCVITSKELLMLATSRGIDFAGLSQVKLSRRNPFPDPKLDRFMFPYTEYRSGSNHGQSAGTSGGYLHYILECFQARNSGSSIETNRGRNADVVEYSVVSNSGEILLRAARYYGFRNIQNLVRRLKPSKPSRMPGGRPVGSARKPSGKSGSIEYAYVEVMACPGGCTNGGGQIKVDDPVVSRKPVGAAKPGPVEQKEWLAQVDEAYFSGGDDVSSEDEAADCVVEDDLVAGISALTVHKALSHWSHITGVGLEKLVYTSFREVVSNVGKPVGDTERVVELAGKIGGGW